MEQLADGMPDRGTGTPHGVSWLEPHLRIVIANLIVAVAPRPQRACIAHREPRAPALGAARLECRVECSGARRFAAARLYDRCTGNRGTRDHDHRAQREPRSV